jgi:electron transfer flavoprotein alpha subunit
MARILVIADHQDGDLKKSTLQTLTLAREIASRTGGGFSIAVIGSGVGAVANQLTSYGAERVLVVDAPAYAHYLAENTSKAVAALAKQTGASFVLSSTGTTGKDMLPRVAASSARAWWPTVSGSQARARRSSTSARCTRATSSPPSG